MTDEAKQIEINQAIEYLREDACVSCIFNSFIGECTSVSDCYARKIADLIESLSAELEETVTKCHQLEARNDTLIAKEVLFDEAIAAGAKMQRERDAMYEILSDERNCADCIHHHESSEDFPCRMCLCDTNTKVHWQWRGVKEENEC